MWNAQICSTSCGGQNSKQPVSRKSLSWPISRRLTVPFPDYLSHNLLAGNSSNTHPDSGPTGMQGASKHSFFAFDTFLLCPYLLHRTRLVRRICQWSIVTRLRFFHPPSRLPLILTFHWSSYRPLYVSITLLADKKTLWSPSIMHLQLPSRVTTSLTLLVDKLQQSLKDRRLARADRSILNPLRILVSTLNQAEPNLRLSRWHCPLRVPDSDCSGWIVEFQEFEVNF